MKCFPGTGLGGKELTAAQDFESSARQGWRAGKGEGTSEENGEKWRERAEIWDSAKSQTPKNT